MSEATALSHHESITVVGAKRRKPNKVTQIQHHPHPSTTAAAAEEEATDDLILDEEEDETQPEEAAEADPPLATENNGGKKESMAMKLPNPLPPGMPPPPISSTSVVEPSTDQMYTCPLCHESQATQKEFTTHIRGHNEVKPHPDPNDPSGQSKVYFCCLCGKMLSSFSSLDRHMLVHSGERPFSCDLCGQTFTTNGNMHRHKRTHGTRDAAAAAAAAGGNPGDANGTSNRSRVGRKRKQALSEADQPVKKAPEEAGNLLKCPVCPQSFDGELNLDHHMYEAHPRQEVACEQCSFPCPNYNYLKLHKTMFHFSSSNSATAASSVALTNTMVTMASTSFQTPPTSPSTLGMQQLQQKQPMPSSSTSLMILPTVTPASTPTKNIIPPLPPQIIEAAKAAITQSSSGEPNVDVDDEDEDDEDKNDLADVQSMLNMAKTGVDSIERHHDSDTEASVNDEKALSSHEGVCLVEDPIIRDMKLKGEFPCRLCDAVYPNLRALKGHNKEHLGKPPYICNVGTCTYSSNDKSTLTRHMRTHTGEKPFECKLCNFGFTTKANCERHLKNKHNKTSREAIRTSIIVHESAEDIDKQNSSDANTDSHQESADQYRCKVCKLVFSTSAKVIAHAVQEHPEYSSDVNHIFEEVQPQKSKSSLSRIMLENDAPSMVPRPLAMIDQLKNPSSSTIKRTNESNDITASEAPLDLSRPSRPSSDSDSNKKQQSSPNSIYSNMPPLKMHGKIPMMQQQPPPAPENFAGNFGILPPGFPFFLPTSAANAAMNPQRAAAAAAAGFPFILPFLAPNTQALAANFMNFMPNFDALPAEVKDQLKQKLGGGGATGADLASIHQEYLRKQSDFKEQKEAAEALQHLSKVQSLGKAPPPPSSSEAAVSSLSSSAAVAVSSSNEKGDDNKSDSDSNYKMVIKNGVLMKKQKQRRYRTERPYSCSFCDARFTLRSNMERHIKQQHPQHWCQKPRGSRRNHTATVPVIAPQFRPSQDSEEAPSKDGEEDHQGSPTLDKEESNGKDASKNNHDQDEEEEEEGFEVSDNEREDGSLIIDEPSTSSPGGNNHEDLASVSKLLNTANNQSFQKYFDHDEDEDASSGSNNGPVERKKSAYSAAPHKIACPYCERKFPWTSSLNRHILTHTGHKPFKCPECTLWFTTKSNCDRHLMRKHGGGNQSHNNNNGDNAAYTMRNVPDRPYKCKMCPSSSFSSASNLRKHHLTKHLNMEYTGDNDDNNDEEGDDEFSMEESNQDQDPSPFKCHICSIGFEVRAIALSHMRATHPEECASIEASVTSKIEAAVTNPDLAPLSNGLSSMSGSMKRVECIFCSFMSKTFLELRRHVSKDHGVKYTCDICQKSFGLKKLLVRHKKKHDSGVSSGDDSEDLEAAIPALPNSSASASTSSPSLTSSPLKKKPSLMDTINKLSKAKEVSSQLGQSPL